MIKMDSGWEKIRREVTCPVCLDILKNPKMLPCLHTYCARCLQELWQQGEDRVGFNQKNNIHCPQCRANVPLTSVENLPSNFSILRLVDIVEMQDRLSKEAPPTCQSCTNTASAVASCTPCGIFLCDACLGVHKTLKLTSSHQINSLEDIRSGKVTVPSILDHRQEKCPIHPDKPLELYCTMEECFICLGCAVVKHRQHRYDFVSEIAKERRKEINATLPELRSQMKKVAQDAAGVRQVQDELIKWNLDNTSLVEKAFQEVVNALCLRNEYVLNEINGTAARRMKALDDQYKELTNLHAQLNGYIELVEKKLKSERDEAIVAMKDQMVNRGSALSRAVTMAKSSPVEAVPSKLEFLRLQGILDSLKVLGMPFSSENCELVEVTTTSTNPTFQVTVKDLFSQPMLNCSSILDVRLLPDQNSKGDVEQPEITDKGNGCYEFSTTNSGQHVRYYDPYTGGYARAKQKYGLVLVRICGKEVPGSPLKFKNGFS